MRPGEWARKHWRGIARFALYLLALLLAALWAASLGIRP